MTVQPERPNRSLPPASPATVSPNGVQASVRTAAARRRTSRRGLLVSVLVIALGGVLAFSAAQLLTRHSTVLVLAKDVDAGQVISREDLTVANVTGDPAIASVPESDLRVVIGKVAQMRLVKGAMLAAGQFGPGSVFAPGQVQVALALAVGQFPNGLVAGKKVLIVATPGRSGVGTGKPIAGLDPQGVLATVANVGATGAATQITVVDVRVPAEAGVQVAQLASTGNLALVLLPDE